MVEGLHLRLMPRRVVFNNKENGSYDRVQSIQFGPDGSKLIYLASKDGRKFVVVDGKESNKYDGELTMFDMAVFSSGGTQTAYLFSNLIKAEGFVVVNDQIINNKELVYDWISSPQFSSDGSRFTYRASKDGKSFFVVDGKKYVACDVVDNFIFSPNSKNFIYLCVDEHQGRSIMNENGSIIRIDDEAKKVIRGLSWTHSNEVVYVVENTRENRMISSSIVMNGKEIQTSYEYIFNLSFSSDGKRMIYKARKDQKEIIVVDGKEYGVQNPELTPAFLNANPIFSNDSKHFAYIAEYNQKQSIVLDGKRGKEYDQTYGPYFSPDNRYIAYGAKRGNELWWIVEDIEKQGK